MRVAMANRKPRWPVASTGEGSFEASIDEVLTAVPKVVFVPWALTDRRTAIPCGPSAERWNHDTSRSEP